MIIRLLTRSTTLVPRSKHSMGVKKYAEATDFRYFMPLQTRFMDCDFNHHVNNSVYTSLGNMMLHSYLLRFCPDAKHYTGVVVSASNDFLKPAVILHTLLGGMKITDVQGSTITLQYAIFNPRHCPRDSDAEKNCFKDIPTNGYIHNTTADIGHILSGFEASPCMTGTSNYMFLTLEGDDERMISPALKKQLQCIGDVKAKL